MPRKDVLLDQVEGARRTLEGRLAGLPNAEIIANALNLLEEVKELRPEKSLADERLAAKVSKGLEGLGEALYEGFRRLVVDPSVLRPPRARAAAKQKTVRRTARATSAANPAVEKVTPANGETSTKKQFSVAPKMLAPLTKLFELGRLPMTLPEFLAQVYGDKWAERKFVVTGGRSPEDVPLGHEIAREDSQFRSQFRKSFEKVYESKGRAPAGQVVSAQLKRIWGLAKDRDQAKLDKKLKSWGV